MKRNYKYNIGDKIQCKDGSYNTIIEKTKGNRGVSAYFCSCEKGHTFKKDQSRIDTICPYCINFKVEKGMNDISTTNKKMFSIIKDKQFCYTHHDGSDVCTEFICPICGFSVIKSPRYVKKYGLRCPVCSDGYSYGEKFFINLLNTINIKFITQYSSKNAKWCGKYKYDFYLIDYDCIIEVNGEQHYKTTHWNTFENEHVNDEVKKELAQKYVKNYVVIDARKSELNYIKNSIFNSKLKELLHLESHCINWEEIQKNTLIPIIKPIVEKYNNYSKNISELSKIFHLSNPTIVKYLKAASLLNLCDYNPEDKKKQVLLKNHSMNSEKGSKPIICLEDNRVFRNARILQEFSNELYKVNLDFRTISLVCNGKKKSYKGHTFKFITREEFNNIKDINPNMAFGDKFYIMEEVKYVS